MPLLTDLQVFVQAVNLGSLSASARALDKTPAAASASLKRLEAELGTRLLERNTRKLRLTPEGMIYHEQVAAGLTLLEDAQQSIHDNCCDFTGEIRLTAPIDFARQWLRPLLNEFQTLHPKLRIILQLEDMARDLVGDPLDLAIRYGYLPDSTLVARRLLDNRRIVVGSTEYFDRHGLPSQPQGLTMHNCITYFHRGNPFRRWSFRRGKETQTVEVRGNRTSNDGSLVREWVLDGLGLAFKSELDVKADLLAGRLHNALPNWQGDELPLQAVYPGTGKRPHRVKALVAFLQKRLQEQQATGPNS